MQIRILVKNLKNPAYQEEFTFDRVPVNIGRDNKSEIILADLMKLVSRQHAIIIYSNDNFKIVDRVSRNFTFLNDIKLEPESEYQLNQGDVIKIGEFSLDIIEINKEEVETDDSQKTMIFSSPFADEVDDLVMCLQKMSDKYSEADKQLRDEYLKMDIVSKFSQTNFDKVGPIISEYLNEKYPSAAKVPTEQPPVEQQQIIQQEVIQESSTPAKQSAKISNSDFTLNSQLSNAFDVLLESATKLIQGFWHFRQEFFGVTIYESMPTTSVDKLKEFLFDPSISNEESSKRLELFKEELNKILSHQVGLLDGYKESINEGINNLLAEVDPDILEKKLKEEKFKIGKYLVPLKYIPLFIKMKLMNAVKSAHKKIRLDISVIERKQFRPAFMKGYQKRSIPVKETD